MFLWGAATAAYQIEGAVSAGGRGPSVWDTFSHEPGRVRDGHTGDTACDHYHRWPEDVALLAGLGVDSYRFSIAWPRVQPGGSGPANPAGLDFYDRLTDALLAEGIVPAATLFHWDLPQPLQDAGGWLSRDTAHRFADYTALVADRLADRIPMWITLNEPFVHMAFGYATGVHAPGQVLLTGALPAAHHQLLGHGLATAALRARGAERVLITNNCTPVRPASADPADLAAADAYDVLHNRLFNDPVLLGTYPDLDAYGAALDCVRDGDLELISAPLDGLGVNYYNPTRIAAPDAEAAALGLPFTDAGITGHPVTAFGWPVVPDGLRELLTGLKARYGDALPPVYVTENGCSQSDEPGPDGTVDDPERIAYLDGHIAAMERAAAEGVDVRGYYVWSLLDNFEWAEGYHQRFGLVHVDFATQRRTPKASYHWFREHIARRRARP
ncbi:beta-glucosidase [Planomonospora parontospora subsp. parontospora]|uniref:Beta-glucosidase n=2 Tax=Planomonospora parontospora TaxID=58119 RepID=A0AA37BCJ6_9ACTN|nr:GH1 family beta-glucosidase [Planomonospora parontospora]GGK51600.1 beta-glucosidase [Planomonospora parontospora]GII06976.1 beta-glucosidase [Planomonospora parontospora subsp. parontospora]